MASFEPNIHIAAEEHSLSTRPPYSFEQGAKRLQIYLWHYPADLSPAHPLCTPELQQAACGKPSAGAASGEIRSTARIAERLAAQLVLRQTLGKGVLIGHNADGSPLIEKSTDFAAETDSLALGLRLSVSHTASVIALALSPRPVGIDIERWDGRALRLASRYLQPMEIRQLPHPTEAAATLYWSAKEAVYKYFNDKTLCDFRLIQLQPHAPGWLSARTQQAPSLPVYYIYFKTFVLTAAAGVEN
ncbi:MAG: 4'-phosphopantetheinyl transferase family protein [Alloprevotella sp.]